MKRWSSGRWFVTQVKSDEDILCILNIVRACWWRLLLLSFIPNLWLRRANEENLDPASVRRPSRHDAWPISRVRNVLRPACVVYYHTTAVIVLNAGLIRWGLDNFLGTKTVQGLMGIQRRSSFAMPYVSSSNYARS